jgi:hypothetical protein
MSSLRSSCVLAVGALVSLSVACSSGTPSASTSLPTSATSPSATAAPGTFVRGTAAPNDPACAGYRQVDLDLYISSQSANESDQKKIQIATTMREHANAFKLAAPELSEPVEARLNYAAKVMRGEATDAERSADQQAFNRMVQWKEQRGC